jgi:hypothetical protein
VNCNNFSQFKIKKIMTRIESIAAAEKDIEILEEIERILTKNYRFLRYDSGNSEYFDDIRDLVAGGLKSANDMLVQCKHEF